MSLRRLAMLEPVYRLAPDVLTSGRVRLPAGDAADTRDVRMTMTDFRLLRHGGFYHAMARYGENVWTTFTYAGLHASERLLRRKEQHRIWGVDCYSHEDDRYLRIGNRLFYENPDEEVEPSAQIVVAADAWAGELARSTLSGDAPTSSARRTAYARQRWNCGAPGTWCPTPPAIPPWASPRRWTCGCGTTRTWRPSTVLQPTSCSWPSAGSRP